MSQYQGQILKKQAKVMELVTIIAPNLPCFILLGMLEKSYKQCELSYLTCLKKSQHGSIGQCASIVNATPTAFKIRIYPRAHTHNIVECRGIALPKKQDLRILITLSSHTL